MHDSQPRSSHKKTTIHLESCPTNAIPEKFDFASHNVRR
ncbi:hypothetical protein AKJ09_08959 [Labilithrix luteola]|uniref:Uncharacterized protein n=1 Tax=Labilithrix luteola TaxID=1391654 RepID=A0A0K1Q932_9BACT|nr:hypothetical protein AKJ09_08959 [Labilithrix luteola]